ncbi:MAG: hypothetical protein ACREBU_00550 [Nitrososphaera sp.]
MRGTLRRHRTFLWGASDGVRTEWLGAANKAELTTAQILSWLCELPSVFGPHAIYVSFAFSYDVTQALVGLTLTQATRVSRRLNAEGKRCKSYIFCGEYLVDYIRGKYFSVRRLLDRNAPYKTPRRKDGVHTYNATAPVRIFDVWAFFQCSFVRALEGVPGCCTTRERDIITRGKELRVDFAGTALSVVREYTQAELSVLVRIMDSVRASCERRGLMLVRWCGAGSIATALLVREKVSVHYTGRVLTTPREEQEWAMHAYHGGRIELLRFGNHMGPLYSYDIASAYPWAASTLPSMVGGTWVKRDGALTGDENPLTLVKLKWDAEGELFGPFPYREAAGTIKYPLLGYGIYCVEEVRAVQAAVDAGLYSCRVLVEEILEFALPAAEEEKPFRWIPELYAERQQMVAAHRAGGSYDLTEKVLKLGLNACYGKLAQKVGGSVTRPPTQANPWYAAVITARTRARMFSEAVKTKGSIVMFATDSLVSTTPLGIESEGKSLGSWELTESPGGVFVQAGVYFLRDECGTYRKMKARGFSLTQLSSRLAAAALAGWQAGDEYVTLPYCVYITLGSSIRNEAWHRHCGYWCDSERSIGLWGAGRTKRTECGGRKRARPWERLVDTRPAVAPFAYSELSAPRIPEWVDAVYGEHVEMMEEQEEAISWQ